jgi:hypothetical protein
MDSEPDAGVKELPNGGFDIAAAAEHRPVAAGCVSELQTLSRSEAAPHRC